MEQIIISLIVSLIVPVILGRVSAKAGKEPKTESIEKFSMKIADTYLKFTFRLSFVPIFFGVLLFIRFGTEGETVGVLLFLISASIMVLFLGIAFRLWKIDVNDNKLTYRSFIGRSKIADAKDIDRIVETSQKSLIIYVRERKFGTINRDFMHISNFHKYCKKKGIPLQPSGKH